MAKTKKEIHSKKVKEAAKKIADKKIDHRGLLESVREEEVEYICPTRGKVKQKVKIYRYKSSINQASKQCIPSGDIIDQISDQEDDLDRGMGEMNIEDLDKPIEE